MVAKDLIWVARLSFFSEEHFAISCPDKLKLIVSFKRFDFLE